MELLSFLFGFVALFVFYQGILVARGVQKTVRELLQENRELRRAISLLSQESTIGYIRVEKEDGPRRTMRFVEFDRNDPLKAINDVTIDVGSAVVHCDLLVVKFSTEFVAD